MSILVIIASAICTTLSAMLTFFSPRLRRWVTHACRSTPTPSAPAMATPKVIFSARLPTSWVSIGAQVTERVPYVAVAWPCQTR